MDLRFSIPLTDTHLVNQIPAVNNLGQPNAMLLKPGRPEESILYLRLNNNDGSRMPPLATQHLDIQGAALIRQWIESQQSTHIAITNQLQPDFTLAQSYPNPFNRTVIIPYALSKEKFVHLSIYNLTGQQIKKLIDAIQPAGQYTIHWDGSDAQGHPMASGIYFYTLQAGPYIKTRKLLLLR